MVIEVEHATFTPLVFSCYGGMTKECSAFFKRLAILISEKNGHRYEEVSSYIRTRLCFSLIRMAVLCIRGWSGAAVNDHQKVSEMDIPSVVDDARISNSN